MAKAIKQRNTGNLVAKSYHGSIILRMLGDDMAKLEEFNDDYRNNYLRGRSYSITKQDLNLAYDWKKGMMSHELAKKYKMTQAKVDSRIRVVARQQLRMTDLVVKA